MRWEMGGLIEDERGDMKMKCEGERVEGDKSVLERDESGWELDI